MSFDRCSSSTWRRSRICADAVAATLLGAAVALPQPTLLPAGAPFPAVGHRQDFVRARIIGGAIHPLDNQDSGALHTLRRADALAIRPPRAAAATTGDPIACLLLS